jgi:hypothetical protein
MDLLRISESSQVFLTRNSKLVKELSKDDVSPFETLLLGKNNTPDVDKYIDMRTD